MHKQALIPTDWRETLKVLKKYEIAHLAVDASLCLG